ncbi:MAG TPA: dihydrolipoyl dehydrogenase [Acidobacteriota bacterium]|nr:dihydrolipoyl dehydrogenase [Acidobacteriota bacterium]
MVVGSLTVETDVVVIGSGPGGYVAALRAAQLGLEVLLVESESVLGGVCLNSGCIPTKAVINASNYFNVLKELDLMGVVVEKYHFDVTKMHQWKDNIISRLNKGIEVLCAKHGVEVITGRGIFTDSHTLHIEGKSDVTTIKFKRAVIATGSTPIQIPQFPYDGKYVISSTEALKMNPVPSRLVIIGGGYIGTEMGTVFGKLGCDVHIFEAGDRLVPSLEKDVVSVVVSKIKQFKVSLHLKTKATSMQVVDNKVKIQYEEDGKASEMIADAMLVVIGRKPNSANIGLDAAGIKVDERGFIAVNEKMQTSVPHIFAIGDVVGQPFLAHKASRQAKVAAEVLAGKPSAYDNKVVPFVVFNDPEICSVGLTFDDAIKKGYDAAVSQFPFNALGKAMIMNETEGFVKIVMDKKTRLVLGVHAVGPKVSELAGEAALAIEMGATADDLALTIHPHPTVSEGMVEAAEAVLGAAIHIFQPKK